MATFSVGELDADDSEESGPEYSQGLSGTTPPVHGRYMKMARRGHKTKNIRKTSPTAYHNTPVLARPHSEVFQKSTEEDYTGYLERRRNTVGGTGSEHHQVLGLGLQQDLLQGEESKPGRSRRKQKNKERKKNRDEKVSGGGNTTLSPRSPLEAETVDVVWESEDRGNVLSVDTPMEGSFRDRLSRAHAESSSHSAVYHSSIHCPPERKQFYRKFLQKLEKTGVYHRQVEGAFSPAAGLHIPRMYSEDLTAVNPYGHLFDHIWMELQAHFHNQSVEDLNQWLFYKNFEIDCVLNGIDNFKLSTEPADCGLLLQRQVSQERMSVESSPKLHRAKQEEGNGSHQQESLNSSSDPGSLVCSRKPEDFLSPVQRKALKVVRELLTELEEAQQLFPNLKRFGDNHPKARTHHFCLRVETLTLWCKVVERLCCRLSCLSSWFGVPVVSPLQLPQCPVQSRSDPSSGHSTVVLPPLVVSCGDFPDGDVDPQQSLTSSALRHVVARSQTYPSSASPTSSRKQHHHKVVLNPYRRFIDKSLKTLGLSKMMKFLKDMINPTLSLVHYALAPVSEHAPFLQGYQESEEYAEERTPLLQHYRAQAVPQSHRQAAPFLERANSFIPDSWIQEFEEMGLPSFVNQYVQLLRVPLDVMGDCLALQLELKQHKPSSHIVKTLVRDCRETLEQAVEVQKHYQRGMEVVVGEGGKAPLNKVEWTWRSKETEAFETNLRKVLELYFDYVQEWVQVSSRHVLEQEWTRAKQICTHIRGGEGDAGRQFCEMASRLLESTGDLLDNRIDECYNKLHGDSTEPYRGSIQESCRWFKSLFVETRERASKALGFAKMLIKDLEVAAEFKMEVSLSELLAALQSSDHWQVILQNQRGKMMFVPESTACDEEDLHKLLKVTFGRSGGESSYDWRESYLLLVAPSDNSLRTAQLWHGRTHCIKASMETSLALSDIQVESVMMVVTSSVYLDNNRNSFLSAVGRAVTLTNKQTSCHQNVTERIQDLKLSACELAKHLLAIAEKLNEHLLIVEGSYGREELSSHYQSTMMACFNLGFECVRDVFRLLGEDMAYRELSKHILSYAKMWMSFVLKRSEQGQGTVPRWAATGLDFLTLACAPHTLATISAGEFGELKKLMNKCVNHLVGDTQRHTTTPRKEFPSHLPWKRKVRLARTLSAYPLLESSYSRKEPQVDHQLAKEQPDGPVGVSSPPTSTGSGESITCSSGVESPPVSGSHFRGSAVAVGVTSHPPYSSAVERMDSNVSQTSTGSSVGSFERVHRLQDAILVTEKNREQKLRQDKVIGRLVERQSSSLSEVASLSCLVQTHFKWRRGRKLGEGRFGKVYECRNLDTSEVYAMKQIPVQEQDHSSVTTIVNEIAFYQKLNHPNIVRFVGVEVYKKELLLFMEYCNEGTLWEKVHCGLSEYQIRRYSKEILHAIYALHEQGIVHRDIKGANIFLTSKDSVKLGDFGLSVQLKNFLKTQPNEIRQKAGTVPYMAPEVVLENDMGRPMDVWSMGCVVVEMATGRIPWPNCDNQFQIMYQLGSGKSPPLSRNDLSDEGQDFLQRCFHIQPKDRWTANRLLDHPFVKVGSSENGSDVSDNDADQTLTFSTCTYDSFSP